MLTDIHSHDALSAPNQNKVLSVQLHPETDVDNLLKGLPFGIWISAGVHPWHAGEWTSAKMAALGVMLSSSRFAFLGEIGLDKACDVPFSTQMLVFEEQLRIADAQGQAVLIHQVGHQAELLALKKKFKRIPAWIIHGFRGKSQTAKTFLANGFFLSFGSKYQLDALRICPLERLFLETDESKIDLAALYVKVAEEKATTVEILEACLTSNFEAIRMK